MTAPGCPAACSSDSYIHDLADFDGAHNDGIDAFGPVKIVHNTVLVAMGQTSAIMLSEYGSTQDSNVLVKRNLIGGGGFSFYGGAPDTAQGHEVVDNLFTTRFFPRAATTARRLLAVGRQHLEEQPMGGRSRATRLVRP